MDERILTYQPAHAYGAIGDCRTMLLIAPDGAVDWGCLPDFDSPTLFSRLLDAEGGYFQIAPADSSIIGSQRYLHASNVLQTTFADATSRLVLTDFMPVETLDTWLSREAGNSIGTEQGTRHCLVRIVQCTEGEMDLAVTCKVTPHNEESYGEIFPMPDHSGAVITDRQQHIAVGIVGAHLLPSFSLDVVSDIQGTPPALNIKVTLHEGERLLFVVGTERTFQAACSLVEHDMQGRNLDTELAHTLRCWRNWTTGRAYQGVYSEWVQRSALTLKLLACAPIDALVAMSPVAQPEQIVWMRNRDYGFTWLHNAALMLTALNGPGFTREARAFVERMIERLSNERDFIYRHSAEYEPPDPGKIILPCTFWLIDDLAAQGRLAEAKSLFERVLCCAGPLRLLSKGTEARPGTTLSNYPPALTHIALITSAVNLQRAEMHQTCSELA